MPEPYLYHVEEFCCPWRYLLYLGTSERNVQVWAFFTIWDLQWKIREIEKNYDAIPRADV